MEFEEYNSPVVVFTSGNYMEAEFVASVLSGSDIDAFVLDDNTCRMYPWGVLLMRGAKVFVRAQDIERAADVLAGVEEGLSSDLVSFLRYP